MDGATLSDIKGSFEAKLAGLASALKLRDFTEDDDCIREMLVIEEDVSRLCISVAVFKQDLEKERNNVSKLQDAKNQVSMLKERLQYIIDNVPKNFLKPSQDTKKRKLDTTKQAPIVRRNVKTSTIKRKT